MVSGAAKGNKRAVFSQRYIEHWENRALCRGFEKTKAGFSANSAGLVLKTLPKRGKYGKIGLLFPDPDPRYGHLVFGKTGRKNGKIVEKRGGLIVRLCRRCRQGRSLSRGLRVRGDFPISPNLDQAVFIDPEEPPRSPGSPEPDLVRDFR